MQQADNESTPLRPKIEVVVGVVEHGDKRGRLLGFPTANIPGDVKGIEDGVWAGTVQLDPDDGGPSFTAALSLGTRPTYYAEGGVRLIEAFLLDFDDQIYGRKVKVTFAHRLRPQWGFKSSTLLVEQLHRDIAEVKIWALEQASSAAAPATSASAVGPARPARKPRGWGPTGYKRRRDPEQQSALREERRRKLVIEAVSACPAGELSYTWVASWTGLPAEYLHFRYPSLEALQAVTAQHSVIR
jgi:hypothetical protein